MNTQHQVFQKLLVRIQRLAPLPTAVVHPCDSESLRGALDAARRRLIKPILVGPEAKIHRVAKAAGLNIRGCEIVSTEHSHAAAEAAVALARVPIALTSLGAVAHGFRCDCSTVARARQESTQVTNATPADCREP